MQREVRRHLHGVSGLEQFESRYMLAAVSWTGGAGDNLWHSPGNWSGNAVPTIVDDVLIDLPSSNPSITVNGSSGTRRVRSIISNEAISVEGGGAIEIATVGVFRSSLTLSGGTIRGGDIAVFSQTVFTSGTLDGVTIRGDWQVAGNGVVSVVNGLTLDGTLTLGDTNGLYGGLRFEGSQTLGGSGSVVFGNNAAQNALIMNESGGTLTIGASVVVRGQRGYLGYSPYLGGYGNSSVLPLGGIEWDSGTNINLDRARNFTLTALPGASITNTTLDGVVVNGDWSIAGNGTLSVVNGLTLNGTLTLGDTDGNYGAVRFTDSQTLGGSGAVVFGNNSPVNALAQMTGGATLTIGEEVTIRGKRGYLGYSPYIGGAADAVVVNEGCLEWSELTQISVPTVLVNNGDLVVDSGATVSIGGTLRGGVVTAHAGSRLASMRLDAVTIEGEITVGGNSGVYIVNGLTVNGTLGLGDTDGYYGVLYFEGSQTLGGQGIVSFANSAVYNSLIVSTGGAALTIGADITVRGQRGYIGYSPYIGGAANAVVVNEGSIRADAAGGTISINGGSFQNPGEIEALNGGTIAVQGSVAGSISSGAIRAGIGSTVTVNAQISNSGGVLAFEGAGTVTLGGTVTGGDVQVAAGSTLHLSGTLDGVTISGDVRVDGNNSAFVTNGLTLNGTLTIGDTNGNYGYIQCVGSQTIGGNGSVVFGNSHPYNAMIVSGSAGGTLTIGADITVRGQRGYIGYSPYIGGSANAVVDNHGTIQVDGVAGSIVVQGGSFQNPGVIKAHNGGTITISGSVAGSSSSGMLYAALGSTINVNAAFNNTDATLRFSGAGALNLSGTVSGGTVSVMPGSVVNLSANLDGVTLEGSTRVVGGISIANGLTLMGTLTLGDTNGNYGYLQFVGSQTIGGSGSVVFGNSHSYNAMLVSTTGGELTIGEGVTVRGQRGSIGYSPNLGGAVNAVVINHGTILANASAGNISIHGGSFQSTGVLRATPGNTLQIVSPVANTDLSLNLSGGGTISFSGRVTGGSILVASGTTFTTSGATLDGVTIHGNWRAVGHAATIVNGLTMFGTMTLGDTNGNYGYVSFSGSQSIEGSGAIVFGNSHSYNTLQMLTSGGVLTVGSGVAIRGQRGSLGYSPQIGGASDAVVLPYGGIDWSASTNISLDRARDYVIRAGTGANLTGTTLNSATIVGNARISAGSATVTGGLSVFGTLTLGDSSGNYGFLSFLGSQSIEGDGSIVFANSHSYNSLIMATDGGTLTIGSGILVRGQRGHIGYSPQIGGAANAVIVNNGTIEASLAGSSITLYTSSGSVLNNGLLAASGGIVVVQAGSTAFANAGRISISPSGTVIASGGFVQTADGSLEIELTDLAASQPARMIVSGVASLNGLLHITTPAGFAPGAGTTFQILNATSRSGQFAALTGLTLSPFLSLQPEYRPTAFSLTAVAVSTIAPDLRVSNPQVSSATLQSGRQATLSWSVLNAGNGTTTGSWTDRVVIVNTATGQTVASGDVVYNASVRGNLPAGSSATQAFTFTLPDGPAGAGTFQAQVATDALGVIAEFYPGNIGESNNTTTLEFTSSLSDYADLQVTGVEFVTAPIQTGRDATVRWHIANTGNAPSTASWYDRVSVVNMTTGQVIASGDVYYDASATGSIGGGSVSTARFFTFRVPDGVAGTGQLRVTVSTDIYGQITEYNGAGTGESNNSASATAASVLGAYPDLSVTSVVVPSAAAFGSSIGVSWTVRNNGDAALAASTTDRLYLSLDGVLDGSDYFLASTNTLGLTPVAPGASYTNSISVQLPLTRLLEAGQYRIIVVSDAYGEQFELDETNNRGVSQGIAVTLPPLPDLIVANIATVSEVIAGQSVTVSWTITNRGDGPANGPWRDFVYYSPDSTVGNDAPLAAFTFNGTLLPGASVTRTQTVVFPGSASGNVRLVVRTDIDDGVVELAGEDNNAAIDDAVINIVAPAVPNLVVSTVFSPASGGSGQPVTVDWIVANTGSGSTNSLGWVDRVFLSLDGVLDADDILLGQVQNGSYLNSGESYRGTLTAALPQGIQGNYRFIVVADSGNVVPEADGEGDNSRVSSVLAVTLTPPPDLFITNVSSAPSQVFSGQQLQVGWTVVNQGNGPTVASEWTDQVFVSFNGSELDANDTLLATLVHTGALAVGQSYSISGLLVALPLGQSGANVFIIVRTDANNSVFEHVFETNNTATRSQGVSALPPPDLTVTAIDAPASIAAGQSITVSYTVTNEGSSPTIANSWNDAVYLSPTPTLDLSTAIQLGTRTRYGVLDVGQSESRSFTISLSNTLSGTFYVIVAADSAGQVGESDEHNNIVAAAGTTTVSFAPPDLAISQVTLGADPRSGQNFTVAFSVTNEGLSATPIGVWSDAVYLSTDPTLDGSDLLLTHSQRSGVLAPGQSQARSMTFRLPADRAGAFYLIIAVDSGNALFELDELNNAASGAVLITNSQPDLSVRDFLPRLGTGPVLTGASLSLDFSVENRGNGSIFGSPWTDRLILSVDTIIGNGDDIILGSYLGQSTLSAGSAYSRTSANFSIPLATAAGNYFLFLQTDAGNAIVEASEANNLSGAVPITITTVPPGGFDVSDLQVSAVTASASASSGAAFTVSWAVANYGLARTSVSSWTDVIWLSRDGVIDANDVRLGAFTRSSALNPGQSYARSEDFTLPIDLSGQYFVIVQTDAGNAVYEGAGEDNNRRVSNSASTVLLTPTADLVVQSVSAPPVMHAGRTVALSWTVANAGGGAATGLWSDSIYLSLDQVFDPSTDISIGYVNRSSSLAAGDEYTGTGTFSVPAGIGGRYYVFVVVDSTNRVYERLAEGNNTGYAPQSVSVLHLPPADLVVGDITIPINGAPGQNATITYSITNNGQHSVEGSWTDSIYISADGQWDINDALFQRVNRSGSLAPGASYAVPVTAALPGVLPGNYKVIVRTDIRNSIPEANEQNNIGGSLTSFAVDAPILQLGVPRSGDVTSNGSVYFRVDVQAGETLVIDFDSLADTGFTELYASFGAVPSRSRADFSAASPFQQDQRISIPITRGGTYYILAFGTDVPAGTASFSITARTVDFAVFDTDFGNIGASATTITFEHRPNEDYGARNTIKINGAKFTGLTTASLLRNGRSIQASSYWLVDSSTLYATFLLPTTTPIGGEPFTELGRHDLIVSDPQGGSVTVPSSVNVIANRRNNGRIVTRFDGASSVQINGTYPVSVQIGNTSTADTYAPLITLSSERLGTPFGFTSSTMAVQTVQFLGIRNDGPAGTYRPGDTATFPLYFRANSTNVAIDMGVITAQDNTPIDWASLKESLRPATISTDAWTPIFQNITSSISTWGGYVIMLNENATALSQLGERVSDLGTLWSFEVQQAMGTLGPVQTLASAVDASMASPGLSLGLSRSFGAGMTDRNATGLFGRGWSTTWDTYFNVASDGIVSILDSAGLRRQFTPVSGQPGRYTSQPGDSGTLSVSNGVWEIYESSGSVTAFRPDGRIDFIQDVNGNRVTARYTGGRLTRLTHSGGQFLTITNNAAGRPIQVVDSAGRSTSYTYDPTNTYLLSATGPDGITTTYTYQTSGSPQTQGALLSITTSGVSQHFAYDTRGRLATTNSNDGLNLITYTYDNAGRVNVADNLGSTSLFYNARGLLSRTQDPFGNITTALYGEDFRISQITDPLGGTQSFTWCDCGSLTSSTDQLGHTTRFTYEWVGPNSTIRRMTSFTDANGNITRYTYDTRGNRTSTIYADNSVEYTNAYDAAGNPLQFTNRRGQVMTYQYNAAGQVTRQTFNDGSFITFDYDVRGNLETITEPGSRITTYDYDTADRLTRVTYPEGRYLDYTYDFAGRRESMTDHTGYRTNYFYDGLGRLERLTDTANVEIVRYGYDAGGRLLRTDKGNGTYTINTYDEAGQITGLVNYAPSGGVSSRFGYSYDALGRRNSQDSFYGHWTYGYDSTGQLTSATFSPESGAGIPAQELQYVYDAVGNRLRTYHNGLITTYFTNDLNQYTRIGSDVLTYDSDGNLSSIAGSREKLFNFDQQNRLIKTRSEQTVTYGYDAFGNITLLREGDTYRHMMIDPFGPSSVSSEYNEEGTKIIDYTHGYSLVSSHSQTNIRTYFELDALGSVASISSGDGHIINFYAYDPFGQQIHGRQLTTNFFTFGGGIGVSSLLDDIFNMRARNYSAQYGRFISIDPIGLRGRSFNLYGYALNSPMQFVDPLGTNPFLAIGIGIGVSIIADLIFNRPPDTSGAVVGAFSPERIPSIGAAANVAFSHPEDFARGAVTVGDYWRRLFDPEYACQVYHLENCLPAQTPSTPSTPVPDASPPDAAPGESQTPHTPGVTDPRSRDPNDILGPNGFGDERWISAANPINYTIRFENDPLLANAPAQIVRITQTLDSDLDPRSVRLGAFGFSGFLFAVPENRAYYATRLDLLETYGIYVDVFAGIDVATGTISWTFTSIDPATGEVPVDRFIGFLPPNITRPEGDGFVSYTVRAKQASPSGSRVDALARIFFDDNAPIDTPPIFNTLDVSRPNSTVAALPSSVDDRRFRVRWAGGDGDIGSGLATYDVFVRRNDGDFELWLDDTTLTDAEYTGEFGSTYFFYSVATDNVGNTELEPSTAQASVLVGALAPTLSGVQINDGNAQRSMINSLTLTFSSPVTFLSDAFQLTRRGSPLDFTFTLTNPSGDGMTWRIAFSGPGIIAGSLADGVYDLHIDSSRVVDRYGQTLAGGDHTYTFHRLFGDLDGNKTVDAFDMGRLRQHQNTRPGDANYIWWLDFDASAFIDNADALLMRRNLGVRLIY